ncbi:MAG: efflux RND transporter permease subunit [Verrucomicrobiota bacterium]|nr:MAG: MMPL family transporter [Verrucomicrobiota bacterium]
MNFSYIFVKRPVATTLLSVGIALAGTAAYFKLPVSPLPQVDFPTITVSASMAGASPETMASSVATPLERHLGTIADVTEMTSSSSVGSTNVTLQFGLNRDIDGAARDVQAAISAARADLPAALRGNPNYRKVNLTDSPVLVLAMTSSTMSRGQLYDAASTILQQKISQVPGVGDVTIGGSSLPAVRVEINPTALFKYGVGLEDVRAALSAANANSPKGSIENGHLHWQIYSNDQSRSAAEYKTLIVAYRNGSAIRLTDVANVLDSVEDTRNLGLSAGEPAVLVVISRQPGANIIETVDKVVALMPQLRASIPGAANLIIAVDRSRTIRASLRDVEYSLGIAVFLVVLVVFFFLRDLRATLIPCVAVPISLIGTFGAMYLLNYSLDNLSLMALTIATGFVVDDAIVVMENIVRYMEKGYSRIEATLIGVKEVSFTVLAMSVSLIAVFIPILLMGGIVGRLFREFAITLSVAIIISMFISLTTTPMMCAFLLRPHDLEVKKGKFYLWSENFFNDLIAGYERTLNWALRHGLTMMSLLVVTVGLNIWLYMTIPTGFFPEQDTGRLSGGIQGEQSISFQRMSGKLKQFMAIVQNDPAVRTIVGFIGGGRGGANFGQVYVDLKPIAVRKESTQQVITRLRPKLAEIPGANLYLAPSQDIRMGGRQSNSLYQYTLQSDNIKDLRTWTPKLLDALSREPVLQDLNTDQQDKGLQQDLVINRDTASRLGLTASQIDNTLYDAFGQRQVSTIYESLNQYKVIMVVQHQYAESPESLRNIYVSTSGGSIKGSQASNAVAGTVAIKGNASSSSSIASDSARNASMNAIATTGKGSTSTGQAVSTKKELMIPLSAFVKYQMGTTPLSVNHQGQFVAGTISFNLADGASLSDAVEAINRQVNLIHMPSSVHGSFQGTARSYQNSISNEPILILAAILTIYVVLGMLYESYIHPLTIISTLPSAGLGALLALKLYNTEFSLIALIGVFLLIGIVKKNAIMMIDFAIEAERTRGLSARDAIFEASLMRFRPILMTTMAAILGAIPLAIGAGDGAELRRPLGISIVGGLIVSQLLTLYTTPVVYLYFDRARVWIQSFRTEAPAPTHVNANEIKA